MKIITRIVLALVVVVGLGVLAAWLGYLGAKRYYGPQLPSITELQNIQLTAPLRVYSADGKLIGQFGTQRRRPLTFDQIPQRLWQAFVAAEDGDFFHHGAVDFPGLLRAAFVLVTTGQKKQGGSTITMQLARDLFLSPEKTYARKIKEILVAQRLEKTYTKQQILALYLNRVFLGHRAFGVAAAAHVYYGKSVGQLDLSQMATLAGLPKAPSADNPISSVARATVRRNYVLGRMRDLGWISAQDYQTAMQHPVVAHLHSPHVDVTATYAAEMVRAQMVRRFGEAVYSSGDQVVTTLDSKDQAAAVAALRAGLLAYCKRHGYDGPEGKLPAQLIPKLAAHPVDPDVLDALDAFNVVGGLVPAVVVSFSPDHIRALTEQGPVVLGKTDFKWTGLDAKRPLHPGDIVRLLRHGAHWKLVEVPKVQGALVALDPKSGAIRALVGGFDFYASKYNRATQAQRQVGSGFKPYLYTSALAKGYTPASTFLNAPVVVAGGDGLDDTWRPANDNGRFGGPMRMRVALTHSVNLVSIRILRDVGVSYMRGFVSRRFGIPEARIPANLTAALGTAALTPLEQARGYSVFANGGYLIDPYLIASIRNQDGKEIFHATPAVACSACVAQAGGTSHPATPATTEALPPPPPPTSVGMPALAPEPVTGVGGQAPRTLDPVDAYLIGSMLHSVITSGTGHAARALGRHDLDGKTGTTNGYTNAWFNGFNPSLVAVVWVGFDQPDSLGSGEFGAKAALPIWMSFMKTALAGAPEQLPSTPPGVVSVRIDPETGKQVAAGFPGAISEVVQADHLPPMENATAPGVGNPAAALY